jgi:competence protein ComEA
MEGVSKQQLVVYAAAAIAIALIGARYLSERGSDRSAKAERSSATVRPLQARRSGAGAHVYVTGAVRRPGVYKVPAWARLDAAVRKAGGPTRGADLEAVNLAAKVADGQQVVVPRRGTGGAVAAGEAASGGAPVSLNTATQPELEQLDGVGPATAQKILEWRSQHGGFRSVEDLKQINGIGPKKFAALKDKVRM